MLTTLQTSVWFRYTRRKWANFSWEGLCRWEVEVVKEINANFPQGPARDGLASEPLFWFVYFSLKRDSHKEGSFHLTPLIILSSLYVYKMLSLPCLCRLPEWDDGQLLCLVHNLLFTHRSFGIEEGTAWTLSQATFLIVIQNTSPFYFSL